MSRFEDEIARNPHLQRKLMSAESPEAFVQTAAALGGEVDPTAPAARGPRELSEEDLLAVAGGGSFSAGCSTSTKKTTKYCGATLTSG
jgi:predicted ribosomally synthesized peptide with nif11-like leader